MPLSSRFLLSRRTTQQQQRQTKPKKATKTTKTTSPPPAPIDDTAKTLPSTPSTLPKSSKRRKSLHARFADDDKLAVVHAGEHQGLTDEETRAYYLQDADMQRITTDIELTSFRWQKAQAGRFHMDEAETSIRGLEKILNLESEEMAAHHLKHSQRILAEVKRQQQQQNTATDGAPVATLNWEQIRAVAEPTSTVSAERAAQVGQDDARAAIGGSSSRSKKSKTHHLKKKKNLARIVRGFSSKTTAALVK